MSSAAAAANYCEIHALKVLVGLTVLFSTLALRGRGISNLTWISLVLWRMSIVGHSSLVEICR